MIIHMLTTSNMQALLLISSLGSRLGDLIKENTQCTISINGVMQIERVLRQLVTYYPL